MVRAVGLEPTCTITRQCTAYKAAEIRSYITHFFLAFCLIQPDQYLNWQSTYSNSNLGVACIVYFQSALYFNITF